jgi:hypothetical protein
MQSQTNTTIITRFTLNLANLAKLLDLLLTYTIRSWLIWQSTNKHGQHKHTTKSKAKTKTTENYLTYKTKQNSRSNQLNQSYKSKKNTGHRKMQVWTRTRSRVWGGVGYGGSSLKSIRVVAQGHYCKQTSKRRNTQPGGRG